MRLDPGAVLLVLRQVGQRLGVAGRPGWIQLLEEPAVLEGAAQFLGDSTANQAVDFLGWSSAELPPLRQAALAYARAAELIAARVPGVIADHAWVTGLLLPLGWLAMAAAEPARAAACWADPEHARQPQGTQRQHWEFDQTALARRLVRAWNLPVWLGAIPAHFGLPAVLVEALGANRELYRIAQLAVSIVERHGFGLCLAPGESISDIAAALQLSTATLEQLQRSVEVRIREPLPTPETKAPTDLPLLRDLLLQAAENRRLRARPTVMILEQEIDQLHTALVEQRAAEAERLRTQKLGALAEFAAGAGHEINNPLAVISGQAQYLLAHGVAAEQERPLQKIITQTHRINTILHELMQFARPPRPRKDLVDLPALLQHTVDAVRDLADQRHVQVLLQAPELPITLYADAGQVKAALTCLLRNAVEAAPAEGWARLRVEVPMRERLELIVEDNGSGPTPQHREHLFDPFYSGRLAGRGRGLGLPTAWRLARENGGDVRFDTALDGPTRFVLSLPCEATPDAPPRYLQAG